MRSASGERNSDENARSAAIERYRHGGGKQPMTLSYDAPTQTARTRRKNPPSVKRKAEALATPPLG